MLLKQLYLDIKALIMLMIRALFISLKIAIKKKLKFHLGYKRWKWREWTKLNVDFSEEKEEEEFKLDDGSPFQMQTIILFCCFRRSAFLLELDISMDLLDDENNEAILNWWETHKLYTKNALQFISWKKKIFAIFFCYFPGFWFLKLLRQSFLI